MGNYLYADNEENDADTLQTYQNLLQMGFNNETLALKAANKYKKNINGAIEFILSNNEKSDTPIDMEDEKLDEDTLKSYKHLLRMEFDPSLSLKAAKKYKNDIGEAICFIGEHTHGNQQRFTSQDTSFLLSVEHALKQWYVCSDYINKCIHIQRLINTINAMNGHGCMETLHDEINLEEIQNDYLHALFAHNSDGEFNFISNNLNLCDIQNCNMFRRNYRNRSHTQNAETKTSTKDENVEIIDVIAAAKQQIFDMIHCYYFHSYDIGNRLSLSDKKQIENMDDEKESIGSVRMKKLNDIFAAKRKIYESIDGIGKKQKTKFNELSSNIAGSYQQTDDIKFSFGVEFNYDTTDEIEDEDRVKTLIVFPKYSSLKEELINNEIHSIQIKVYNTEYNKAEIKCNSEHYRAHYNDVELKYIFVVMLYCNRDEFQRKFSETYRKIDENESDKELLQRHCNFYYYAKCLEHVVNNNGSGYDSDDLHGVLEIYTLYHGIGQTKTFPAYVKNIIINVPLSTTQELTVAHNFTYNNGLVIALVPHWKNGVDSSQFGCEWLSDFPDEKEYLFVQNKGVFVFNNIINTISGAQYKDVLYALTILNQIGQAIRDGYIFGQRNKQKREASYQLIKQIIHHQLSYKSQKYARSKLFDEYECKILNVYCKNKTVFEIQYKKEGGYVYKDFCCESYAWIDLDLVHSLYSNIETLILRRVIICKQSIVAILRFLKKTGTQNSNLKLILVKEDDGLSSLDVMSKYGNAFEQIQFTVSRCELGSVFISWKKVPQYFLSIQKKGSKPKYVDGKKMSSVPSFAEKAYFF